MTSDGGLDKSSNIQCEGRLRHLRSALGLACTKVGEGLPMGKEESRMGPMYLVAFTEPWKTR